MDENIVKAILARARYAQQRYENKGREEYRPCSSGGAFGDYGT